MQRGCRYILVTAPRKPPRIAHGARPEAPTGAAAASLVSALLGTPLMNMTRKRRVALLTALAILLFAGSALATCTSHSKDSDHDGIPNCIEKKLGTNPHSADTDHDGLSDGLELMLGTDPHDADTDGDGESDGVEEAHGRDPMDGDDDADEEVSVKIKSPVAAVDPVAGTVTLLGSRLTVDATGADLEGIADLAELQTRVAAGGTVMAKVKIDPASLAGTGTLVATKVEVEGSDDEDDVRCCLPGDGTHDDCDRKAAGDCAAAGGLNMGPGSCEPNPCP